CTEAVYRDYQNGGRVPTLCVLRDKLLEQEEPIARELALELELFTEGSLDAFAHESNVDMASRIVVYDIMNLRENLKTMGLLVITDAMLNRVTENWRKGKRTHIFLDEFHVVFENELSGQFFNSAWRRFRKRGAFPNALTQNVDYLLDSTLARSMLSNSEFIVMLNQAGPDRERLAELLNISNEQMSYITNVDAGCGLIKYGSSLVPFTSQFPKDTQLYRLMTTKPGEDSENRKWI
ncbi:type IV secretory system conjugative DNA transfer family protein, partial [Anaerovorax odorimutans]|nr:type IV secretory system conjugative DNA transfer family protein [Anaerovorax odorimutans]